MSKEAIKKIPEYISDVVQKIEDEAHQDQYKPRIIFRKKVINFTLQETNLPGRVKSTKKKSIIFIRKERVISQADQNSPTLDKHKKTSRTI